MLYSLFSATCREEGRGSREGGEGRRGEGEGRETSLLSSMCIYLCVSPPTCLSFVFGKGMPTVMTARAFSSAKSSPSLTFPRHTARKRAPVRREKASIFHSGSGERELRAQQFQVKELHRFAVSFRYVLSLSPSHNVTQCSLMSNLISNGILTTMHLPSLPHIT